MFRSFRWLLLVTVLVLGAWYVVAPRRTYERFLQALLTGSEAELVATVDFPRVRDNLKQDIAPALERAAGGVGAALGGVFVEQAVNSVLTPTGLAQLVNGFGSMRARRNEAPPKDARTITSFRYRSPSRVEVRITSSADPDANAGILTFSRTAFTWRLTRITSDALTGAESGQ
ncbi:MAG: DUF2939 domain-containing protein [Gemmatimonadales bacterium]|nr:DUF2939 domain-containing protein [Gemmatimonadales bacterium]